MANFRQILVQKKIDLFFEILSLFNEKNQKVPKSAKRSARNDFVLHLKSAQNCFLSQVTQQKKIIFLVRLQSLFYRQNKHSRKKHPVERVTKKISTFPKTSNQVPPEIEANGMFGVAALCHIFDCLFWPFWANSGQTTVVTPNLMLLPEGSIHGV